MLVVRLDDGYRDRKGASFPLDKVCRNRSTLWKSPMPLWYIELEDRLLWIEMVGFPQPYISLFTHGEGANLYPSRGMKEARRSHKRTAGFLFPKVIPKMGYLSTVLSALSTACEVE